MVSTITYAVRVADGGRWPMAAPALYASGCVAGAMFLMTGLSLIGIVAPLLSAILAIPAIALCSVAAVEGVYPSFGPPRIRRQVDPCTFARRGPRAAATLWGLELGLGVVTLVNTWALWGLIIALMYTQNVLIGVTCGVAYGVFRGLDPVVAVATSWRSGEPHPATERPLSQRMVFALRMGGVAACMYIGVAILVARLELQPDVLA